MHSHAAGSALTQPDIMTNVISYLELRDMASCCSVSHPFRAATAQVDTIQIQLNFAHSVQQLQFATRVFQNLKNVHLEYRGDALVCPSDVRSFLRSCCATIQQFYFTSRYTFGGAAFEPLRRAPQLEKLRLKCCRFDSVDVLIAILEGKTKMNFLDLSLVKFGPDSTFLRKFDYQPIAPYIGALYNLEELILDGWDLQYFDAAKLFLGMPKLAKLIVCEASDESLVHLSQHCRNLRALEINGGNCRALISVSSLCSMLHSLPVMETLYIPQLKLHDADVIDELCEAGGKNLKVLVVSPDLFSRISVYAVHPLHQVYVDLHVVEEQKDSEHKHTKESKKMSMKKDGKARRTTDEYEYAGKARAKNKSSSRCHSDTHTRFKGELGDSILHAW